jgi:3-phosphoshikimate 1-carboxyvinyltransferase
MKTFEFNGKIDSSKSLFNRALTVQSHFPSFDVQGQSACEDVRAMKKAVSTLIRKQPIDCGAAGTVLRFMAFRVAREAGTHLLIGTKRLLERPQAEISYVLNQLGVHAKTDSEGVHISGEGWKKPMMPILVRREDSSQFASGLVLSAWNLDFNLEFKFTGSVVSEPYWVMTLDFIRQLGMEIDRKGDIWTVPAKQKLAKKECLVEPDYSSMASIAMLAALFGKAHFKNFESSSLQPDYHFTNLLKGAGVSISLNGPGLQISKMESLKAQKLSIANNPDLFPSFAVFCSYAVGDSILNNAPHLVNKESNRIEKTAELLKKAGVKTWPVDGGLGIEGRGREWTPRTFEFDPDQDHRMAMAAGIYKFHNQEIKISNPQVVDKSFPDFWRILGFS